MFGPRCSSSVEKDSFRVKVLVASIDIEGSLVLFLVSLFLAKIWIELRVDGLCLVGSVQNAKSIALFVSRRWL